MLAPIQDLVFDHLAAERAAEERQPSLLAGKLHANASSAGACARQIAFRVSGVAASNPITGDSLFNFAVGDAIHDQIQNAILAKVPGAEKEVSGVIEDFITCRADLKYPAEDGKTVCGEIKSVSDFAFKLATGAKLKSNGQWNKKDQQAEGVKKEHLLQVGISAKSNGADYLSIVYSRKTATKGEPVMKEWRYSLHEVWDAVESEIGRLRTIVNMIRAHVMPDREYNGEIIENPAKTKWPCSYCGFRDACIELGPGEVVIK